MQDAPISNVHMKYPEVVLKVIRYLDEKMRPESMLEMFSKGMQSKQLKSNTV